MWLVGALALGLALAACGGPAAPSGSGSRAVAGDASPPGAAGAATPAADEAGAALAALLPPPMSFQADAAGYPVLADTAATSPASILSRQLQ
ncbi:MAG TPA: hypothetical protein VK066_05895 [Chloroflexota bacterium]|nr:hypothetical protein [Chloroflexota bacterium]